MLAAAGYGIQRGFALHDTQTLADIIVGALTGGIVNWTVDKTYSLETGLHDLAVALADLLGATRMAGCDRRAAAGSAVLEHHDAIDRQARRRFSRRDPRARAGSGSTGSCGGTCAQRRDRGRGPRSPRRWSSGWSARWCMRVAAPTRFARRPRVWSAWWPSCCPTARRLTPKLTFGRKSASESPPKRRSRSSTHIFTSTSLPGRTLKSTDK